jgi:hypothetical protein
MGSSIQTFYPDGGLNGRKPGSQIVQANRLHRLADPVTLVAGVHHETPVGLYILAGDENTLLGPSRATAGMWASRSRTKGSMRRGIILVIKVSDAGFARDKRAHEHAFGKFHCG